MGTLQAREVNKPSWWQMLGLQFYDWFQHFHFVFYYFLGLKDCDYLQNDVLMGDKGDTELYLQVMIFEAKLATK